MDDKKSNAKGVSPHLIIVVSAVLGVAVSVVFFGLVRFAAKRVLSEVAGRIGGSDAEAVREFDEWMTAWTKNARTNMAEETSARFRDEVVIPFLKREMPNPFSEGGADTCRLGLAAFGSTPFCPPAFFAKMAVICFV